MQRIGLQRRRGAEHYEKLCYVADLCRCCIAISVVVMLTAAKYATCRQRHSAYGMRHHHSSRQYKNNRNDYYLAIEEPPQNIIMFIHNSKCSDRSNFASGPVLGTSRFSTRFEKPALSYKAKGLLVSRPVSQQPTTCSQMASKHDSVLVL